jgi:phosphoribosylanthranilate isomerase
VGRIKICGLFREQDIDFVNQAGPDYIGFVFAPSPRQVSAARAKALRAGLAEGIVPVGVFVNAEIGDIVSLWGAGVIQAVQLHGGENQAYIKALKQRCALPVIKAVRGGGPAPRLEAGDVEAGADYLLFDSGKGGSGAAFDWSALAALKAEIKAPWFLAGGITADNIAEALSLGPYCVDVSSGAETGGVKDRNKIRRLVRLARQTPAPAEK